MKVSADDIKKIIISLVSSDGKSISNKSLFLALLAQSPKITEKEYQAARDALIEAGELARGRGRGGSVYRVAQQERESADDDVADDADDTDDDEFVLESHEELARGAPKKGRTNSRKRSRSDVPPQVLSYRHPDKRANNPEVGMVHPDNDPGLCFGVEK